MTSTWPSCSIRLNPEFAHFVVVCRCLMFSPSFSCCLSFDVFYRPAHRCRIASLRSSFQFQFLGGREVPPPFNLPRRRYSHKHTTPLQGARPNQPTTNLLLKFTHLRSTPSALALSQLFFRSVPRFLHFRCRGFVCIDTHMCVCVCVCTHTAESSGEY